MNQKLHSGNILLPAPFSHIVKSTISFPDERDLPLKELAVKRFIDLLFLNSNCEVSLQQESPLTFSEIEVKMNLAH